MRKLSYALLPLVALLAACETPPPHAYKTGERPPYLVPATAVVQDAFTIDRPLALQTLPTSDADYYFPRMEKFVYGAISYGEASAYTTYTYDSQAISIPGTGGSGYRYRWVVQQGISSP